MVVDALGLELVFFLLAIQLREFLPAIRVSLLSICLWCCATSFFMLRGLLRASGAVLAGRATFGISLLLFVLSKNVWCPLSRSFAEEQLSR